MENEIFCKIEKAVKEAVGTECSVIFDKVKKNNGVELQYCVIKESGKMVTPLIYIDEMLAMLEVGDVEVQDVADRIVNVYKNHGNTVVFQNIVENFSKELILGNVMCQLVNRDKNKNRLMIAPHVDVLDLAVMYRVFVGEDKNGIASFVVSNDLCKNYGISLEELDAAAMENTKLRGFEVHTMASVLTEIIGMPVDMPVEEVSPLYVLSNRNNVNGANVMLFPEEFKKLSNHFKDDLYVLPSSIHEVLVIPAAWMEPDKLAEMVSEVNATQVSKEEFLSNSVYRYDKAEGKLKIAQEGVE